MSQKHRQHLVELLEVVAERMRGQNAVELAASGSDHGTTASERFEHGNRRTGSLGVRTRVNVDLVIEPVCHLQSCFGSVDLSVLSDK